MLYAKKYESKIGMLELVASHTGIVGLYIENQKYYHRGIQEKIVYEDTPILMDGIAWLDAYFNGDAPSIDTLRLEPRGTSFQQEVWKELCKIAYGKTTTYGSVAATIAKNRGIKSMSSQAVGQAIGKNPISIMIPCHRVIGKDKSLVGYAGGLSIKRQLLIHENVEV